MNLQEHMGLSSKEQEQFAHVCNQLLSHTFILRSLYTKDRGRIRNPDYTFVTAHFEVLYQYFALIRWQLFQEDHNGYCYIINDDGTNRLQLSKEETALFLCLRLIYDEKLQDLGMGQDVIITVQDLLDKLITDFGIMKSYSKQKTLAQLAVAEKYRVIQRIKSALNSTEAMFAIMPSILTAVPSGRIHALVQSLEKKEES